MQIDEFFDFIRNRRSVRRFKQDPIPDEYVEKILDAGRWAMSGANAQPWEFIVVKDRETKERATKWRNELIKKAFEKGLLLLGCGDNTIRFCPALMVKKEEVDMCLSIFGEAVREVAG